jgi:Na+/H+ antiporter NhaD/arsenite permease-like protein
MEKFVTKKLSWINTILVAALLMRAEEEGMIEGIKICRGAPWVNHLFFANDSLILMRASNTDAKELKQILDFYEKALGQMINKDK